MKLQKFDVAHYFSWLEHQLEKIYVDGHVGVNLILVALTLIIIAFFAGRKYRQKKLVEPQTKVSFLSTIVYLVEFGYEYIENQIGTVAKKVFWLVASFFVFIMFCNLWGLVPGMVPPTEKFSFTLSLGVISFICYNYLGIKDKGFGYIKDFLGPVFYIAPLIFLIELISHIARPVTLGLRLFGNITGDHFVVSLFTEEIFPVLLPLPFVALGIFISIIQAFVFFQLSVVYVQGATSHDH